MSVSDAVQLERERRKSKREDRLWSIATDPTVKRLALLSLIVAYSTYITRSKTKQGPVASALALTLPTVGIPMLAAEAGVTDWRALMAIGGMSGGLAALSAELGLQEAGQSMLDNVTWHIGDYPVVSLAGPIPAIQWWLGRIGEIGDD